MPTLRSFRCAGPGPYLLGTREHAALRHFVPHHVGLGAFSTEAAEPTRPLISGSTSKAEVKSQHCCVSRMEWTGRAPAPTATELVWGFREHEERIAMTCKIDVAVVHTIGIDT